VPPDEAVLATPAARRTFPGIVLAGTTEEREIDRYRKYQTASPVLGYAATEMAQPPRSPFFFSVRSP
jgi:hypothetical protein